MFMLDTFQQAPYPMLPVATGEERSRQEIAESLKQFIQGQLLLGLQAVFEHWAARGCAKETRPQHPASALGPGRTNPGRGLSADRTIRSWGACPP
jgi:hypothetical protein